ncbi:hypothetical protein GO755_00305 [Spirosoma sp. HMF4905]|uniref:Uncharacterized protein n=1 Tax=Spirosoma arboris TaxID=2682092 RepID=A0A7K1S3Q2_9BACT|nr:hypothetical protein [Spirosoma arboris]MVM28452.1 hypothetical protein [Spirosoma arboris]
MQYQPQESSVWAVGDLYQFPTGLVLCVGANHTFAYFVTAEGMPLADVQLVDVPKDTFFLHNTGLTYQYESREQVQQDYKNGLFTPYFVVR